MPKTRHMNLNDWQEIEAYLHEAESPAFQSCLQLDHRYETYVRAQKLIRRLTLGRGDSARMRNGVITIAKEYGLSTRQTLFLLRRLVRTLSVYQAGVALQRASQPTAVITSLSKIRASVLRVGRFGNSKTPADRHAMDYLQRAMTKLSREMSPRELEALGIEVQIQEGDVPNSVEIAKAGVAG